MFRISKTLTKLALMAIAGVALSGCVAPHTKQSTKAVEKTTAVTVGMKKNLGAYGSNSIPDSVEKSGLANNAVPLRFSDFMYSSYYAAEKLVSNLKRPLDPAKSIIVASVVDIDNVNKSTTFGRMLSEHVASRLSLLNLSVSEVKHRNTSILVRQHEGEFILSRNTKDILPAQDAQAVFAGTYAVGQDTVYVSVRLLRATDGVILSSFDYRLEMSSDIRRLLGVKRKTGEYLVRYER